MIIYEPLVGINVRDDEDMSFAKLICDGSKTIETRDANTLNPYVNQRVRIIRTGVKGQKAMIVGECTIGIPIVYTDETEFELAHSCHLVKKDSKYWIKEGNIKYGYPILNPVLYDKPYLAIGMGIVSRLNQPPPIKT